MITIKTKHYEHKYHGRIHISFGENMLAIEAHSTEKINSPYDLDIWCSDIYDWFWLDDVISISSSYKY